jgi:capsular polysaccharide export protein
MKILSVGYYDDFARFFLEIKKQFQGQPEFKFKYLTLYFSGYFYSIVRGHFISWISMHAWLNSLINRKKYLEVINSSDEYLGIKIDSVIQYHIGLGADSLKAKLQACSYISIMDSILNKFKPELIICSSDSRMLVEILIVLAKRKQLKLFYFEQGPYGTTVIDTVGVNANSSFRGVNITSETFDTGLTKVNDFMTRKRENHYKRNPIYRGSDYILEFLFFKIGLYPIDLVNFIKNKKVAVSRVIFTGIASEMKVYLLILQVPYDVNMVYHSPLYDNHLEILKSVFTSLPNNSKLIVREHPLFFGKYEPDLYKYIQENEIILDDNANLKNLMNYSNVVIVNNSTVGLEAISMGISTVVLGNCFYDSSNICLKLKCKEQLSQLLSEALEFKLNRAVLAGFLKQLYFEYLLEGHFRDQDISELAYKVKERLICT